MPLACTAPPILPATKTTNGTRATSRAIEQQQQRRRSHVRNSAAAAAAAAAEAATSVSGEQAAAQGGPSSSTVAAILLFVLILPAAPDPAAAAAAATGAHHNATTPLSLLNPWLSACDIADPATAPDLRGSCSARDAMPSLSDNNHYSNNYDSGVNKQRNNNSSSNYGRDTEAAAAAAAVEAEMCCGRAPLDALKPEARAAALRGPAAACRAHLRALARLDALAATLACKFDELLRRYDCAQDYSVSFGCAHCQECICHTGASARCQNFYSPLEIESFIVNVVRGRRLADAFLASAASAEGGVPAVHGSRPRTALQAGPGR
ncbi:uncharacterized protein LOC124594464 [Schistocerca americana]|uniref:uncharacterized protein LOC124594464 n=1 Tax=Schistocerca americana TaxID=7009 RepID=UPI001F4FCC2F|nr:uncharacterized protein LOC124594464 [Schistocerca americana]